MVCRTCKSPLTTDNWSTSRKTKGDRICTSCKSTEMRKFREYHKESTELELKISRKKNCECYSCGVELIDTNRYGNSKRCKVCDIKASTLKGLTYTAEEKMFLGAQARCRNPKVNREFTIELSDIIIPSVCPVFGIPMERASGKRGAGDYSPTLDRIDSTKGYIKGNIEVISWKANRLKSNGTLDDFRAIVRHLEGK